MERRDHGQIQDDEPGFAAVEEEILHVPAQPPIRDDAENDGEQQVQDDQSCSYDPSFH